MGNCITSHLVSRLSESRVFNLNKYVAFAPVAVWILVYLRAPGSICFVIFWCAWFDHKLDQPHLPDSNVSKFVRCGAVPFLLPLQQSSLLLYCEFFEHHDGGHSVVSVNADPAPFGNSPSPIRQFLPLAAPAAQQQCQQSRGTVDEWY